MRGREGVAREGEERVKRAETEGGKGGKQEKEREGEENKLEIGILQGEKIVSN